MGAFEAVRTFIDLPQFVAVVMGEIACGILNMLLYPFDRTLDSPLESRFLLTALVCNHATVIILRLIIAYYWPMNTWQDALYLSSWLTFLVASLEAPHFIDGLGSLAHFVYHVINKFVLMFSMLLVLLHMTRAPFTFR